MKSIKGRTQQVNMHRQFSVLEISDVINGLNRYDAIIDVRSPAEYEADHIPNAENLFVLNDQQRAEVGTIYANVDPFSSRKIGAGLISQNIATHLNKLQDRPKSWRPLIYCWRGGQRSGSMALVMTEIGWPVTVLGGGYKSFRRYIRTGLDGISNQYKFIVLTGPTGAGKTKILRTLQSKGSQILDLEGLAHHRGSILGQQPNIVQPSQKFFETNLFFALSKLDINQPVWIESESSKIGNLYIPNALFANMGMSHGVSLECPPEKRADFLLNDYSYLISDPITTKELITRLAFRHPQIRIAKWRKLIDKGNWRNLALELLKYHYDPAYAQSQKRFNVNHTIHLKQAGKCMDIMFKIEKKLTISRLK